MTEKDFSLVRRVTDFLRCYKPEDYEIFASESDEILVKIYSDKFAPEVFVMATSYDVTFKDDTEHFQLSLDKLIEVLKRKNDEV